VIVSTPQDLALIDASAEAAARVMEIPFLGRVPLTLSIRMASDAGTPPAAGEGEESALFASLASRLLEQVNLQR
jgi:ATP-binding protein involved in chromosome partitioning